MYVLQVPVLNLDDSHYIHTPHPVAARHKTIINLAETTGKEAPVTNAYEEHVAELGREDVT
jgi:hypothetical protein